jgi:hypothetical protein
MNRWKNFYPSSAQREQLSRAQAVRIARARRKAAALLEKLGPQENISPWHTQCTALGKTLLRLQWELAQARSTTRATAAEYGVPQHCLRETYIPAMDVLRLSDEITRTKARRRELRAKMHGIRVRNRLRDQAKRVLSNGEKHE